MVSEVDVYKAASIEFERGVREGELEALFTAIKEATGESRIRYVVERAQYAGLPEGDVSLKVHGSIIPDPSYIRKGCAMAPFEGFRNEDRRDEYDVIDGIKFMVTPGYDFDEISEGEKQVWEDTRKAVENYMKSSQK